LKWRMRFEHLKLLRTINRMIGILGAMFVVGTALSFFLSVRKCAKVDLYASPRQGALWALFPSIVYMLTGNSFAMVASTWVPTLILLYTVDNTICEEPSKLKHEESDKK